MRKYACCVALVLFVPVAAFAADLNATPADYRSKLGTLAPGDTLHLAAGSYSTLPLSGINGASGQPITITGPDAGAPATIAGNSCCNTVEITNSSYLVLSNLVIDNGGIDGVFGISAKGGTSNLTHDITIEGCTIQHFHPASQQDDGISTKTPTWNWIIRGNRILGPGTGIYLGNSDGSDPFVAGLIEDNLIENPVGYCMEIKWQKPRPTIAGMPTTPQVTIIRDNVFIKNDQPSPDGDRPNLLVGGFPSSGAGAQDRYEIYGNLFFHNPRESLFQGSGRVSLHDNLFVDVAGNAMDLQNQDLLLEQAYIYNNTIYAAGTGIRFQQTPPQGDGVVGNLIFAATPITGPITDLRDNLTDTVAKAGQYVKAPSTVLGSMDFYPKPGAVVGSTMDLSKFDGEVDYDRDFNRTSKGTFTFRGAYAGSGINPGWSPAADLKAMVETPLPDGGSGSTGSIGSSGGAGSTGSIGSSSSTGSAMGSTSATGGVSTGSSGGDGAKSGGCGCGSGTPIDGLAAVFALALLFWRSRPEPGTHGPSRRG